MSGRFYSPQHSQQNRRPRSTHKRTPSNYTSLAWRLTSKLEEAVKTYQKALQLHQEKRWAEAERAYLNLLMTEIVADRLSKKVRDLTLRGCTAD